MILSEVLVAVMRATRDGLMGAGDDFIKWVRKLLWRTQFVVLVNGYASDPVVQRVCARAAHWHLCCACLLPKHCNAFCVLAYSWQAQAQRCSSHCTDDTQVLLCYLDHACAEHFVSTMHVFGLASDQCFYLPKCKHCPLATQRTQRRSGDSRRHHIVGLMIYTNVVPVTADQPIAAKQWWIGPNVVLAQTSATTRLPNSIHLSTFGGDIGCFRLWPQQSFSTTQSMQQTCLLRSSSPSTSPPPS